MVHVREDGTEERIVRAKWSMDGAESIEEMAEKLEEFADSVRELEDDGWELEQEVENDYAFLIRSGSDAE